jgi:murein DD-endopeptidase MepM/ murein hydrolase activator NlpD
VIFAGQQRGYGQTVVVEHDGGVRTRYAHLSAVTVQPGQQLAEGEVLGRVGRSGRATGPHLHFEVLKDGARIDPLEAARTLPASLKIVRQDDDSHFDRGSARSPAIGADDES